MLHLRIEIPAHDGVILRGLRYAPSAVPAPTILTITPYRADGLHADGVYFASRGFNFVAIDCRGRGDSDGEFVPFVNDGADGNSIVNRLAEHPWSNGDIVTYGGSYCGFNQWVTAATHPRPLRAIAPVASVYPGRDFPYVEGIPLAYAARWLTLVNGRRLNRGPFDDDALWDKANRDLIAANRPHRDLDLFTVGDRLPIFQEWLNHPDIDDYWTSMVPTQAQLAAVTIPILTITGQYDDDQQGALTHLAAIDRDGHDVLIGPWDHEGTRTSSISFGGLTFADSAKIDLKALHADWFNWILDRGPRPELLADRFTYFHTGENRWRTSPTFPAGDKPLDLHLAPNGVLTPNAPASETLNLPIDPKNAAARPEQFETEDFVFPMADLSAWQESLLHITEPLPDQIDITGCPSAHLELSSDLPDFDLMVSIYLLREDKATKLGEHPFRARHNASPTPTFPIHQLPTTQSTPAQSAPTEPAPAQPAATQSAAAAQPAVDHAPLVTQPALPGAHPSANAPLSPQIPVTVPHIPVPHIPVTLANFPFISLRTEPGDRIALLITPPDLGFAPNFQTGGNTADELPGQAVAGTVHIHQHPDHPSYLRLPIAQ